MHTGTFLINVLYDGDKNDDSVTMALLYGQKPKFGRRIRVQNLRNTKIQGTKYENDRFLRDKNSENEMKRKPGTQDMVEAG